MRYPDRTMVRVDNERPAGAADLEEIDAARAREYALLATLLSRAPDQQLLSRIAQLPGDASPLGAAHAAVAEAARGIDAADVEREYFALFVGLGRGELLPYGSYYLSGFLHDRPLARLREDLAKLSVERASSQAEPEDHAAMLCEVMAGVVSGRFPAAPGSDRLLFEKHPRRGSGASSPTWSERNRPGSIAPSARSVVRSSTSRLRPSHCRPERGEFGRFTMRRSKAGEGGLASAKAW